MGKHDINWNIVPNHSANYPPTLDDLIINKHHWQINSVSNGCVHHHFGTSGPCGKEGTFMQHGIIQNGSLAANPPHHLRLNTNLCRSPDFGLPNGKSEFPLQEKTH